MTVFRRGSAENPRRIVNFGKELLTTKSEQSPALTLDWSAHSKEWREGAATLPCTERWGM
jgi:hypothetical protein